MKNFLALWMGAVNLVAGSEKSKMLPLNMLPCFARAAEAEGS